VTLLAEWALTPAVFDESQWSSPEAVALGAALLRRELVDGGGLVRDLRDGAWSTHTAGVARGGHRLRMLLEELGKRRRLLRAPNAVLSAPTTDIDWCHEACASHSSNRVLGGVVTVAATAAAMGEEANLKKRTGLSLDRVACPHQLGERAWWPAARSSMTVPRRTADYLKAASPALDHANSVWFIDPYLNPARDGYRGEFSRWLERLARRKKQPDEVLVHCATNKTAPRDIKATFEPLIASVANRRYTFSLVIWGDFHDRHLLTDIVGFHLSNGFDVVRESGSPPRENDETTTWSRLDPQTQGRIFEEFDPANRGAHGKAVVFEFRP
jgi:hypothetical protein